MKTATSDHRFTVVTITKTLRQIPHNIEPMTYREACTYRHKFSGGIGEQCGNRYVIRELHTSDMN